MGLLLDSHVFLWFLELDPKLSSVAVGTIEKTADVFVSAATIWEFLIKAQSGKLERKPLISWAAEKGISMLSISPEHAEAVALLPRYHRDPFDHMLLAQAKVEGLTLVTHDRVLGDYGVPVLLV